MAHYANIREMLGFLVGRRVVDVTQHDEEEWQAGHEAYIELLFDNGATLRVPIGDEGFEYNNPDEPEEDADETLETE